MIFRAIVDLETPDKVINRPDRGIDEVRDEYYTQGHKSREFGNLFMRTGSFIIPSASLVDLISGSVTSHKCPYDWHITAGYALPGLVDDILQVRCLSWEVEMEVRERVLSELSATGDNR
jgi:hypothetical protein